MSLFAQFASQVKCLLSFVPTLHNAHVRGILSVVMESSLLYVKNHNIQKNTFGTNV